MQIRILKGVIVDGALMAMGVLEAYDDAGLEYPYMTVDDLNLFRKSQEVGYTDYISVPGEVKQPPLQPTCYLNI